MTGFRPLLAAAALSVLGAAAFSAQAPAKNPLEGNADAIAAAWASFAPDAPTATAWTRKAFAGPTSPRSGPTGRSDEGLFKTIKGGMPGTEMPANPVSSTTKSGR